jgi:hypothetical protein
MKAAGRKVNFLKESADAGSAFWCSWSFPSRCSALVGHSHQSAREQSTLTPLREIV